MSSPDADDKRRNPYEDESGGIPRWLTGSLILAAVVALLVVVVMLVGGGHSPRSHGAGTGAPAPPAVGTVSLPPATAEQPPPRPATDPNTSRHTAV